MTIEKNAYREFDTPPNEQDKELHYLLCFVKEADFSEEISCLQLKSLWTAYCLHNNLDVDTFAYDRICREIWNVVEETEPDTAHWSDLEGFDLYMSDFLT